MGAAEGVCGRSTLGPVTRDERRSVKVPFPAVTAIAPIRITIAAPLKIIPVFVMILSLRML
jgi:hypothetical protein